MREDEALHRKGLTRRGLLRIGAAGAMGLSLSELLAAGGEAGIQARADSLIIIFLNGGPSHLDMWDMKPNGPTDIRGEFKSIASSLTGVQLSEHLPKLARQMHLCTLVRSMHHSVNNSHAAAVYVSMTGHDRGEQGGGFQPTDNPSPGALAALLRPTPPEVAPHVTMPYKTLEGATGPPQPGFFGGWLGRGYDPLWILKDPNAVEFSVPEFTLQQDVPATRLANRSQLLSDLNVHLRGESAGPLRAMHRFQQQATDILTSKNTQAAFRIEKESEAMRDAYGRNIYGQSVLLARRLIEAGTRVVTVSWAPDANATWDTHSGNFAKLKDTLLPQFDAASSALLSDLHERGMLDRTLVAVLGDFGRTPKINGNNAGRDHWNYCYSLMLAGGGVRPGFVYGASDKQGAFPADRPTAPADIMATIYHQLGIDHRRILYDRFGRPHRIIPTGGVIRDLLA
ncbi:MAG: DUF1501 domain-containing protein [Planctomycetaceae bacterium]|nr:DUF1501 domain-containing protein [Planctomycetales bacterium]MCB9922846.1 DUF1501 domain-containing protein [Planctomycetaceae bacterium]